jgi:hypothetical protein
MVPPVWPLFTCPEICGLGATFFAMAASSFAPGLSASATRP